MTLFTYFPFLRSCWTTWSLMFPPLYTWWSDLFLNVWVVYSFSVWQVLALDSKGKLSPAHLVKQIFGGDRYVARHRVNTGYSFVIELAKCALKTQFIIQDFLQINSIQPPTHPCIQPISHVPTHLFNHPSTLLFSKHSLNLPCQSPY